MNTLKRILNYTKNYWKYLLLSIITASFYGIFSAAPTYILKHAVDDIFIKKINNLLIPFILGFILLFALKGLFMYLSNYYMNFVGNKVINDIRLDLFKKVIHFPISFFQEKTTGQLMSHFLNDIQMIQNASASGIKNGVRSFFEAIFLLGVAFTQNWKLALLMILVGPLIGISIKKMGAAVKQASFTIQKNIGNLSTMLQEIFIGIREVKAFNGEKIESDRFADKLKFVFSAIMQNVHIESFGPAFIETVAMLGSGVVFYVAAHQIMAGTISAGQLTAFFAAVLLAYQPLKRLINVYAEVQYGLAAAERIFEVMDKFYPAMTRNDSTNILTNSITKISFENVSFNYNENIEVLKNINLVINSGESIGIMGESGSGKSTFCDLILSFISPKSGKIFINNHDIENISFEEIRDKIGYVGQKTFLFNDTITANVAYSQSNKNIDDIIKACKAAHADEFIQKLPEKYNTIVGENGCKLSGGQKQRLTIARALLKNPEILIFDEATSALDQESENLIRLAIEEISKEKTIIVISHRLSFIEKMNRVLLVKNQNIFEISKKDLSIEINRNL
ncbi:ABC transporter ATP-binding protein/permease [Candidatus Dependentiae bacterium]|nr:ABC transporter ATP-binding protein/permease [Candidatus Dependentiae bacterium]MCG2756646.1 ABC transporter ATP-binding protein/permease [Candidatus Dependentiae bacterium]